MRITPRSPDLLRTHPFSRFWLGTIGWAVATALAVLYGALAVGYGIDLLHAEHRGISSGLCAATGLSLLGVAIRLRARREAGSRALSILGIVPIVSGVAEVAVNHDLRQLPFLVLVLVGIAGAGRQLGVQNTTLAASERHLNGILAASPVGIAMLDEDGIILSANPALCAMLGRTEHDIVGATSARLTHPEDRVKHSDYVRMGVEAGDGVTRVEKRYVRPSGEVRWGWLTAAPVAGPEGQAWSLAHIQDITDRKAAEQELRDSESNLAAVARVAHSIRSGGDCRTGIVAAAREIAEAAGAVLLELGDDHLEVTAASGLDMLGVRIPLNETSLNALAARTGQPIFEADPHLHPDANHELLTTYRAASSLCHPLIASGRVVGVLTVTWDERIDGMHHRVARAVALLADEAALALEHAKLLQDLEQRATTDTLTELPNRRAWDSTLDVMLSSARVTGRPVTVAIADLDRFKAYNDTHGHTAGDELLRAFATFGSSAMRGGDLFARWGGEEFGVALPDCDAAGAQPVLERLRHVVPDDQTCSIGVATWDGHEDAATLLSRADAALYEAKNAGRDRIVSAIPLSRIGSASPLRRRTDQVLDQRGGSRFSTT